MYMYVCVYIYIYLHMREQALPRSHIGPIFALGPHLGAIFDLLRNILGPLGAISRPS